MSYREQARALLDARGAEARAEIARRTGAAMRAHKSCGDLRGAEELARQLAQDAVELVREAIAREVARNPYLPEDIAKRIAHDVDNIAVPFLEVTEVFDDEALARLVTTLSEAGRTAVARRDSVSQPLCRRLGEVGAAETARTLAANPGARLGAGDVRHICDRFAETDRVLEAMAERAELPLDVVEALVARVSRKAARKLMARYDMPDFVAPIVPDAQAAVMLNTIQNAPSTSLHDYALTLHRRDQLCPRLIVRALRLGVLEFFESAMAVRAGIPLENARRLTREGGAMATAQLSHKAEIPAVMRTEIRDCVEMIVGERRSDVA